MGGGSAGNVPADTIVTVAPGQPLGALVNACTNPFPATGGQDAETNAQVRARAPQQFSAEPLRVVRAADYVAAAQSVPWVQQAGTTFRWTGSWLTVLTSADPAGREEPTIPQLADLTQLLNQRRLAGYESYVLPPRYVAIDLQIILRGQPDRLRQRRAGRRAGPAAARLAPRRGAGLLRPLPVEIRPATGIQRAARRDPVLPRRRRGSQGPCTGSAAPGRTGPPLPDTLTVAADQILRADNDPEPAGRRIAAGNSGGLEMSGGTRPQRRPR